MNHAELSSHKYVTPRDNAHILIGCKSLAEGGGLSAGDAQVGDYNIIVDRIVETEIAAPMTKLSSSFRFGSFRASLIFADFALGVVRGRARSQREEGEEQEK